MFRTVVDTKRGRVWANHPLDQRMILVADIEEDADDYLRWSEIMGQIRKAPVEKVEAFAMALEANIKKIEKNVDINVNTGYAIDSDRGNPEAL